MGTCLGCGASWSGFGAYCNMCKISGLLEKNNSGDGSSTVKWSDNEKLIALKIYAGIIGIAVFVVNVFPDWGISKFFKFIFIVGWGLISTTVYFIFSIIGGFFRMLF